MARYRHWKNLSQGGQAVFITTTALDFVQVFAEPSARDEMVRIVLAHCQNTRTGLTAFVVMPHHIHLLATLPEHLPVMNFVKVLKMLAAHRIRPMLPPDVEAQFDQQRGLNRRTFWQRSFRSQIVEGDRMFWDVAGYIHLNPVRAGFVERPEMYRWSSARFVLRGYWSEEMGLDLGRVLNELDHGNSLNT